MRIDTIFENARFTTLDNNHQVAEKVGVLDGKVVGLDDELDGIDAAEHVDLEGAYVVPGFNDVHAHVSWLGRTLSEIDLTDISLDIDQVYQRIQHAVNDSQPSSPSDWVLCSGFDHHRFHGQYPQISVLDQICQGRPLFMRHTSGHSSIANTEALTRIGALEPNFQDPEGGHIVRDEQGKPTGLVQENAQSLLQDLFKPYSLQTMREAIDRAGKKLAADGITSVCDAGIGEGWIGDSPIQLLAYQQLADSGKLSVRTQAMPTVYNLHGLESSPDDDFGIGLDLGIRSGLGDEWLSIGPTKLFADGSLSGETAAMTVPYKSRPGYVGSLENNEDSIHSWIVNAIRSGWSVATHAIGDRGVDAALDAYEEALQLGITPPMPLRIEHAGVMRPDQLDVIARLGVVPTTQSVFYDNIGDGIIDSLEPEVLNYTYRAKSLLDHGITLPGSSDAPCASDSALLGIEKFVTRTTGSGRPFGPRSECLTTLEALQCYTTGSAKATGYAGSKGRISRGYFADFTCLAQELLTTPAAEIPHIPIRSTVAGGRFTYHE
ncbi:MULTISPECIES: amidohydrolase [Bifidobacterium]|jgi:predicted amidohydrolase YtcJ|uniref:Amidohydrolase n=1 Tax=Bifidobacterium tibiigranuli TaxID=2172043 RepID=A0A5N6S2B5_9BIFI|nr:amidohydrolase [Bifidobacterium tibiigranuli]KAE8127530.1 amidohydrolase [Bifidobacterium tibiigranuli]KAE8127979.1 amidohydrolase [Bifidobacterium tibiigranuli]MCI1211053.1 amidohydrolase [Bifidobacterium tibiigranuli]MCI1221818.1 amidohydrolase [Bifidobacterium tibiigranuli]